MDTVQHSFDNFGLHQAAARGDLQCVRMALDAGADVNALDNTGRTVIACAVAGEDWEKIDASDATFMSSSRLRLLSALVQHPNISLSTLNAPQSTMRGVTPLGMAAWLNMPDAVRVLLEHSGETVSVDGMDTHGATALMYATRDGSLEVVRSLLQHGARPDFRDVNHRTSIHYALPHPQILWLCETVLRRHRWRENESVPKIRPSPDSERLLKLSATSLPPADSFRSPPLNVLDHPASTNTLIKAIRSSELSFLHSLLFSSLPPSSPSLHTVPTPILVNRPDSKGWSAIHYCVSVVHPSVDVLDALYCAGCDVSLFTAIEHYTPLHCLAQSLFFPNDDDVSALYQFIMHLVCDLRAPLSARDKHGETCIHIAAERGQNIDVLIAFLDCDTTGSVRELRNSRGLTASQLARPEFRSAFGEDAESLRPPSSLSMRTIRPVASCSSISSLTEGTPYGRETIQGDNNFLVFPSGCDGSGSSQRFLNNLRLTSPMFDHDPDPVNVDYLDSVLGETVQIGRHIVQHFRTRIASAAGELSDAKKLCNTVCTLRGVLEGRVGASLEERRLEAELMRRRTESEDSQVTACDPKPNQTGSFSKLDLTLGGSAAPTHKEVSVMTEPLLDLRKPRVNVISGTRLFLGAEILESFIPYVEPKTNKGHLVDFFDPIPDAMRTAKDRSGGLRKDANIKLWMKTEAGDEKPKRGTAKFRAWLRKKITPEPAFKLDIVTDIDEGCGVGREVKQERHTLPVEDPGLPDAGDWPDGSDTLGTSLQRSHVILAAADRDLACIRQRAVVADQFIQAASQSVLRAEQIMQKALKKREAAIADLRRAANNSPAGARPLSQESDAHAAPQSAASSARSSIVTLSVVLPKGDDEDTKALQRLLLRKIEARMVGAFDEIDNVVSWLRIVKEVVRGVKRRTYL